MSKKRQKRVDTGRLYVSREMHTWLKELAAASGSDRSEVIRSLLQAIMDDDERAHGAIPPPVLQQEESRA